jgi:uncharacterized membrane protein YfcA
MLGWCSTNFPDLSFGSRLAYCANNPYPPLSMNWPLIVGALAAAGFVQGLTGFGFGLVAMSLLPAVLGIKQAAAIGTVYGLLVTIATFLRHYRDYNWRLGLPFLISSMVGVPIGVYFLEKSSEGLLLKILGGLMVYFAAREFLLKRKLESISTPLSVPFGIFSGGLSGAFNLGGIPTATYAYAHPWTQGQIIAFLQVMLVSSCTLRLIMYGQFGYFREFSWTYGIAILIPLFAAMMAGHYLMKRIPVKTMRRWIFVFIGVSGVYYLLFH